MERPLLQSALRELQLFLRSPRFWATFGAVVLIFWVTGPYGTGERLAAAPRLGFWLVIHGAAWSIAILFVTIANLLLMKRVDSTFLRMVAGAAAAAPAIGLVTEAISAATFGETVKTATLVESMFSGLLLSVLFCTLTFMTMNAEDKRRMGGETADVATSPDETPAAASGSTPAEVPLMRRLKPELRGPLLRLEVEDHYVAITTTRGRELVLLRFSDALGELGDAAGLQVHRSHWVADDHVDRFVRTDGRMKLVLKDGQEVPVSRSHADSVRARWG